MPETIIIPATCRERFIPLGLAQASALDRLGVVFGGRSVLHPPYTISRHDPPFDLLMLCQHGRAKLSTPQGNLSIAAGQGWFTPAHVPHRYVVQSPRLDAIWFCLDAGRRWFPPTLHGPQLLQTQRLDTIDLALTTLLDEATPERSSPDQVADRAAALVAALIERLLVGLGGVDPAHRLRASLDQLWQRVNGDLQRPWTVAALAREYGVSAPHLQRLVQAHQGISPMSMVTRLRLHRAMELLQGSDFTLERIAQLVGYATPFALSRTFFRVRGVRPSAYRRGSHSGARN